LAFSRVDVSENTAAADQSSSRLFRDQSSGQGGKASSSKFFDLWHDYVTFEVRPNTTMRMAQWFWYAVAAAVLYGAHQIFTRLASDHIGDGLGGFLVEATAAVTILLYLATLWLSSRWNQKFSSEGFYYSALTGICVGAGTIAFFLLFQKGGPLSAVPAILAGGAAIMAIAGIVFFREPAYWQRLAGITLAIVGLFLLRK
jgi:bacterial/archaeal transporter family protein